LRIADVSAAEMTSLYGCSAWPACSSSSMAAAAAF
jgi:hypothetical protein